MAKGPVRLLNCLIVICRKLSKPRNMFSWSLKHWQGSQQLCGWIAKYRSNANIISSNIPASGLDEILYMIKLIKSAWFCSVMVTRIKQLLSESLVAVDKIRVTVIQCQSKRDPLKLSWGIYELPVNRGFPVMASLSHTMVLPVLLLRPEQTDECQLVSQ